MSKCMVFSESVEIEIIRNDQKMIVKFCELEEGDHVVGKGFDFIVDDCHQCEDPHYDGWICYDTKGNDYYPEDFGAKLIRAE